MNKNIKSRLLLLWAVFALAVMPAVFTGCKDDVDDSDLYTFVGEMITDYLNNNEEQFSDFTYVVEKAGLKGLLSAYGAYTLFAPTNEAIQFYLDSLYSIEDPENMHGGLISNKLEDITDSMALSMAYSHLVNKVYLAEDLIDGTLPTPNMNSRFLSVTFDSTQNRQAINVRSVLIQIDEEVENGVVHVINQVIAPSNEQIPDLIMNNDSLSIFAEALKLTGLEDSIRKQEDYSYVQQGEVFYWPDNEGYYTDPDRRMFGYTILMVEDAILRDMYGITHVDELIEFANRVYGEYSDNVLEDYTDRKNPLNRLISYHIIPARLDNLNPTTFRSTIGRGVTINEDIYEYYETLLPNAMIKVSMVKGRGDLRVNYYTADPTIHGAAIKTTSSINFDTDAINGTFYCLDKLIYYDKDVYDKVLHERMRFDAAALIPELSSNNLRFYGYAKEDGSFVYFAIPPGYSDRVVSGAESRIIYLTPNMQWSNYMGDEFNIVGRYDLTLTLPPVPEPLDSYQNNTYEIRIGFKGEGKRGIAQIYIDGLPVGTPIDMQVTSANTSVLTGYEVDSATDDDGVMNDKMMRNLGFMKAPSILRTYQNSDGTGTSRSLREISTAVRRIVTTMPLSNDKRHTIRIKSVLDDDTKQFHLDYIEIVPKSVYAPTTGNVEDRK